MKTLACELCGSNDIVKKDGLFECAHCGTKYSTEEAQKLFVEVSVKEDNSQKKVNYLEAARKAREMANWQAAAKHYDELLAEDPENWEAMFFSAYCANCTCKIAEIANACARVKNAAEITLRQIKQSVPAAEQKAAVQTVVTAATSFGKSMFEAALKHHMSIDPSVMSRFNHELKTRLINASYIMVGCACEIMNNFGNNEAIATLVQLPAKEAIALQRRQSFVSITFDLKVSEQLLAWIGTYDPAYVENYKKKQNSSMLTGNIFLLVVGLVFLFFGLRAAGGSFGRMFCLPMAIFCLAWAAFRIVIHIVHAATKK